MDTSKQSINKSRAFCVFFCIGASGIVVVEDSFITVLAACLVSVIAALFIKKLFARFDFRNIKSIAVGCVFTAALIVEAICMTTYVKLSAAYFPLTIGGCFLCIAYILFCGKTTFEYVFALFFWVGAVTVALSATSLSNTVISEGSLIFNLRECLFCAAAFLLPYIAAVLWLDKKNVVMRSNTIITGYAAGLIVPLVLSLLSSIMFSRISFHIHPLLTLARISDLSLELISEAVLYSYYILRCSVFLAAAYNCLKGYDICARKKHYKRKPDSE